MVYLDYAATTPVDPQVIESMYEYMKSCYGNPSSKYYTQSELAKASLNTARESVSKLINCKPEDIQFNSGATEGNNFILKGVADSLKDKGKHIITSSVEHKAILSTCKYLESNGFKVTYLPVNEFGQISLEDLKSSIKDTTILVSIMWGNNEIGSLNDIKSISDICLDNKVKLHTDATQVLGKLKIDLEDIKVDFLTCSAHKIYGPKGIGATYIRSSKYGIKPKITPLIHGGAQEDNLRAGTESTHNIVGFGKACEIALNTMDSYIPQIKKVEQDILDQLSVIPNIKFNGYDTNKVPGIINFTIPDLNNEFAIKTLSKDYALSSGSACAIGEPSHVLKELGHTKSDYFRISIGKFTESVDLSGMIETLKQYV